MENSQKSHNFYPYVGSTNINGSDNSEINSLKQFTINCTIEISDCFLGEFHEREEISNSISKYANVFEILDIGLAFYYVLVEV